MSIWWFLVLAVPALLLVQNLKKPDLGVRDGRLKALGPKPNAVSSQSADERKRVDAIDCANVEAPIHKAADVLATIIVDKKTATPFTIGIFGEWGTGKTSLLRMIEEKVRGENGIVAAKESAPNSSRRGDS